MACAVSAFAIRPAGLLQQSGTSMQRLHWNPKCPLSMHVLQSEVCVDGKCLCQEGHCGTTAGVCSLTAQTSAHSA